MYTCIAVGFAAGVIGGIVIWALAAHKREALKKIDWKQDNEPKSKVKLNRVAPLLQQVKSWCQPAAQPVAV